jgi:hypothetical protein
MALPKKGAIMQFMVPLIDTDGLSVMSAITESDFNSGATRKFYGVDHGVSDAFTSGTISKAGRLVRSGVFQITIKGTENAFDKMMVRITKTGILEQIYEWDNWTSDDSDIVSQLTLVQSMASDAHSAAAQANSRVLVTQSMASDAHSAATQANSRALLLVSSVSDVQSQLLVVQSMASDAHSAAAQANSQLLVNQSVVSDVLSHLVAESAVQSNIYSLLSDLNSEFGSRVPSVVPTVSNLSDVHSDLKSAIGAITVSLDDSNISDIASAVVAALPITSMVSDIYSLLSDLNSEFLSRVPSEVSSRSQVSDLISDLRSVATVNQSVVSDIYSLLQVTTSMASDAQSAAVQANSRVLVTQSLASDAHSAAAQANSRILVTQSMASDAHSAAVVIMSAASDIYSAVGAGATISASSISDIASAVWARTGSDPTTVPAANAAMGAKVDWLLAGGRNKIVQVRTGASAVQSVRNDADSADIASALLTDDGTTFTRGEFA